MMVQNGTKLILNNTFGRTRILLISRCQLMRALRTICACHDWCSPVHKTTYKQQDERRRTRSSVYGVRCALIGLCTMQKRMFRCTESIYYRITQPGLARVIGCSIMRIIFRSGSSRPARGRQIHLCPPKRYKNGDAVLLRVQDSAPRAKPDRRSIPCLSDESIDVLSTLRDANA